VSLPRIPIIEFENPAKSGKIGALGNPGALQKPFWNN